MARRQIKVCPVCSAPFKPGRWVGGWREYCSLKCRGLAELREEEERAAWEDSGADEE